ncbi:MAG: hypothetical protein QM820_09795 [Minicystis sp.]
MRNARRLATLVLLVASAAVATPAWADSAEDRAAADTLFKEGRALVKQGRHAEGCAKLAASQKLDPATGTLLALGDCYELDGRTASAWGTFNEAAVSARKAGDTRRADEAQRRAGLLEPKLSKLVVEVAADGRIPGLEVKRNGKVVDAAVLGTAVPVDPGEQTLEATAPGRKAWKTTLPIASKPGVTVAKIPALAAEDPAPPRPPDQPPVEPSSGWSTQRTVGLAVGGVGVVGVVVGAVFGALTLAKVKDIDDNKYCSSADPPVCSQVGLNKQHEANTFANVSNVGLAVGGAALVAGVVVFVTAPRAKAAAATGLRIDAQPLLGPSVAGLSLRGAW